MKITKRELKETIMEEVKSVLNQNLNETPSFEDDSEILKMATFADELYIFPASSNNRLGKKVV